MATTEVWSYGRDVRTDTDLTGYDVDARDGEIGSVDEATNEVGASYLIVDTGPWVFGKKVLLPAGVIERVDHDARRIVVGRTRDEIKNAPEYNPEDVAVSAVYRQQVGSYYEGLRAMGEDETRTSLEPQRRRQGSRSSSRRTSSSSRRSSSTKSSRSRARTTRSRTRRQTDEPTKEELYEEAKRLDVEGRSKMNKTELKRAIGRARGRSTRRKTSQRGQARSSRSRGSSRARANPVEVQAFLDGVSYPTRKGDLVREAERSRARREVRETLERLPEKRFGSPTEVSEAIGKLR